MRTYIEKAKIISLSTLFLVLCWACSNDMEGQKEGANGNEPTGTPVQINADVSSVEISEGQSVTRAGRSEGKSDMISFVQPLDKNYDTGYDIETTIEPVKPVQTRAGNELLKNSYFKLLAYTGGTVSAYNYVGQGNFKTDANGIATVVAGQEMKIPSGSYIFVGYSYGKDEELGPQRPDYPFVPVSNGGDFMTYSSPVINVEADETGTFTLRNIKFTRQSVKLQVKITVAGFNEDIIKNCTATLSNLNDRLLNWTIGEATFPLRGASGSIDFTWASNNTAEVMSEEMYDFPIDKRDLVLTLKQMTIGDYVMKNVAINLPDQVFVPSDSYLLTVNLNQNYIDINGIKWAKGNVYKSPTGEFKFEANQEDYHAGENGGSYFGWNTLDVTRGAYNHGEYDENANPCLQVAPKGTWKIPSVDESKKLNNYELLPNKGAWFGPKERKRLFLPATGFRSMEEPGILMPGETAYYQLSDKGVNVNNTYTFFFFKTMFAWQNAIPKSDGNPIRCIKK